MRWSNSIKKYSIKKERREMREGEVEDEKEVEGEDEQEEEEEGGE
jgi:hypothetical protein